MADRSLRFAWLEGDVEEVKQVTWKGDRHCDLCDYEVKNEGEAFFDARTRMGLWAKLCSTCWDKVGAGALGTGHGQKYVMTNGKLIKVEG